MGFKFIHAADIHLDSPLRGLSAYENAPADQLRNASRKALEELVTRAIDEQVTFMVIAGDLYDGDWRDYNTGIFFVGQMGRLARAGIRVYLLHGNHDAESQMTRKLALPDNVTVFSSRAAQVHRVDGHPIALHGHSFASRAVEDNLVAGYPPRVEGHYNIGVLHTALEGYSAHASYAPCTIAELQSKGYDYWALGHVHEFQQWNGPCQIVFPGNLQGRHIRETGRKGAVCVTVDDAGASSVERMYIDVLRWEVARVDVAACKDIDDVARAVRKALRALLEADDVPRAVRVLLEGETALHGHLAGNARGVRAQVLAEAAAVDAEQLWVEKVRLDTRPEQAGPPGAGREALADLEAILGEAAADAQFHAALERDLAGFVNRVPPEVSDEAGLLQMARAGEAGALVARVVPGLLAQLASKGL